MDTLKPPYNKLFTPCLYIVHTFLPPKKGHPLNNGQNARKCSSPTCPLFRGSTLSLTIHDRMSVSHGREVFVELCLHVVDSLHGQLQGIDPLVREARVKQSTFCTQRPHHGSRCACRGGGGGGGGGIKQMTGLLLLYE